MKKYFLLIMLFGFLFSVPADSYAFSDIGTHPDITGKAVELSILKSSNYLTDNLGFEDGLGEIIFSKKTIKELLSDGARSEDTGTLPPPVIIPCSRGLNHFYDPISNLGLHDISSGKPNLEWAKYIAHTSGPDEPSDDQQESTVENFYSWPVAREAFYRALKAHDNEERNKYLARMFRSVGQVAHLLEDMAVPAHVRNDMRGHLYYQSLNGINPGNWFGNNFEAYVKQNSQLITSLGTAPVFSKFDDYWDSNKYTGNDDLYKSLGNGLAEYTQANFLSENRMIGAYPHPSMGDLEKKNPEEIIAEDGMHDNVIYYKKRYGEPVEHLMAQGFLNLYIPNPIVTDYYLDDVCYADYAAKLVPKAVDYSTGLINYFFRGALGVTEAAIIDGDNSGIKKIKAKVVNTTNYNGQIETMPNGDIFAFARYKTGPNAKDFSYAVAHEVRSVDGAPIQSVDSGTPQEMVFYFSGYNPLPADVTELYLHVVYYGTLGQEVDTGVAIGMAKVGEYVLLRSSNYCTLFSTLSNSIPEDIKNPRFEQKNSSGNPLYPDAKPYFKFPELCTSNSDFGAYTTEYLSEAAGIALFEPVTSTAQEGFDNNQEKLFDPAAKYKEEGVPASLSSFDYYCEGPGVAFASADGEASGWSKVHSEEWDINIYVEGAWNKIRLQGNGGPPVYASSYEVITHDTDDNQTYVGSWDYEPAEVDCDTFLNECHAYCTCVSNNAGQPTRTTTGRHNDVFRTHNWTNYKKYTPLGPLWEKYVKEADSKTKEWGTFSGECSYSVGMCGYIVSCQGRCCAIVYPLTIAYNNSWGAGRTTTYDEADPGSPRREIIEHNYDPDYNTIDGKIQPETQLVMQVHYHALEIRFAGSTTQVAPEIHVAAQLDRHFGVYDAQTGKINFDTKADGRRNGNFEKAAQQLIEFVMQETAIGKRPQGLAASFMILK